MHSVSVAQLLRQEHSMRGQTCRLNWFSLATWRSHPAVVCRYWKLGSLGPTDTPETAAKRDAVQRARQYGDNAAHLAKTACVESCTATRAGSLKPPAHRAAAAAKAHSSSAPLPGASRHKAANTTMSKTQRAKEFANSVRALSAAPRRAAAAAAQAKATARVPADPRRVSKLLEQHEKAAELVAGIKEEVATWPPPTPTPPVSADGMATGKNGATRQQGPARQHEASARRKAPVTRTTAPVKRTAKAVNRVSRESVPTAQPETLAPAVRSLPHEAAQTEASAPAVPPLPQEAAQLEAAPARVSGHGNAVEMQNAEAVAAT